MSSNNDDETAGGEICPKRIRKEDAEVEKNDKKIEIEKKQKSIPGNSRREGDAEVVASSGNFFVGEIDVKGAREMREGSMRKEVSIEEGDAGFY
ncbi:hypothetical protein L6452_26782 [Arctium lappa]|uniref:Uncharacterized protein n=1 Tax=Arctium lappa TaxID=4217 RepID=A0ACB8ZVC3_ARCLA|nr:hypothetical protein L6452_26782 [Arctium lappa]